MQQMTLSAPVLVVNTGSSSLKLTLFRPGAEPLSLLVERIDAGGHRRALLDALATWRAQGVLEGLAAVGHRVVHGGEGFIGPARVDATVIARIRALASLAPLHNAIALQCIEAVWAWQPGLPQVACFDTAFHHDLPPQAFHYALPPRFYREHGIRRYGFHGLSLASVCRQAGELLARPLAKLKLIVAHLGNGASLTAIDAGRSVETSMGFTPLEGLVMGSRAGDLDPAIPIYLIRRLGMSAAEVEHLLNHQSGLKGLCDQADLREIHTRVAQGDEAARLALAIYVHRIRKYLGAYSAVLGGVDALIFTAGVGEHDARVREAVCAGLDALGYVLEPEVNRRHRHGAAALHAATSHSQIWVIPTDEAGEIAREVVATLNLQGESP